jgi:hypothetical protein
MSRSPRIVLSQRRHSGRNASGEPHTRFNFRKRSPPRRSQAGPSQPWEPSGSGKDTSDGVLGRADRCRSSSATSRTRTSLRSREQRRALIWNQDRIPDRNKLMILAAMTRVPSESVGPVRSGRMRVWGGADKREKPAGQHHSRPTTSPMVARTILSGRLDCTGTPARLVRGTLTAVEDGASGGVVRGIPLAPWR